MSALVVIQLIIGALTAVANAAGNSGLSEVASVASDAAANLARVIGTEVTKAQLDGLDIKKQW